MLNYCIIKCKNVNKKIVYLIASCKNMNILESSGLLSSSCGGLGPFGPKIDFAGRTDGRTNGRTNRRTNRRTDGRTTGLRELDIYKYINIYR